VYTVLCAMFASPACDCESYNVLWCQDMLVLFAMQGRVVALVQQLGACEASVLVLIVIILINDDGLFLFISCSMHNNIPYK
jgi:hypothetical protein